jgi:hypothetical protein
MYYNAACEGYSCAIVDVLKNTYICLDTWTTKT